jgi:uncharacterized protein (DUF1697 family)
MTKYVALLRGINVGGNNIIKMLDLKSCFEKGGYANVITYIQSGNVIFESEETSLLKLEKAIENVLSKTFNYESTVMVRSYAQMKRILADIPKEWKNENEFRCYVAFIKDENTVKEIADQIEVKEHVDSIKKGKGALYMTTVLKDATKSAFNKLASKKIYKEMTIRNYNTTRKIALLME